MDAPVRDTPALELALLRQGVSDRAAGCERCEICRRTPLSGERVYVYENGSILCELCRSREHEPPLSSHMIQGPEFGHTVKNHRPPRRRVGSEGRGGPVAKRT